MAAETAVLCVERLRLADDAPMAIERAHFCFQGMDELARLPINGSLYELLRERFQLVSSAAIQEFEARLATPIEQELLHVGAGAPVLTITRTTFDGAQRPFEFVQAIYRADRYRVVPPSPQAQAASGDPSAAYAAARITALQLRAHGVNLNFAPILDVSLNPSNPVIGIRGFGPDAEFVSRCGVAALRGYHEAGVIATVKHFPGHGHTAIDSHLGLPVVMHGLERLEQVELAPFRTAFAADAPALMVAHVVFSALDTRPATLSPAVLRGLLRDPAFSFGGQQARVADGVAKLADGTLTGSVLTMDRALALLTRELGPALPAAVGMLTRNPARAARVGERKGALAPGYDADLLIFDADLRLQATFCRGALAYATPAWQERFRHALA